LQTANLRLCSGKAKTLQQTKSVEYYRRWNEYLLCLFSKIIDISLRDVRRKYVLNNVDKSSLRAPWQNDPTKMHKTRLCFNIILKTKNAAMRRNQVFNDSTKYWYDRNKTWKMAERLKGCRYLSCIGCMHQVWCQ